MHHLKKNKADSKQVDTAQVMYSVIHNLSKRKQLLAHLQKAYDAVPVNIFGEVLEKSNISHIYSSRH